MHNIRELFGLKRTEPWMVKSLGVKDVPQYLDLLFGVEFEVENLNQNISLVDFATTGITYKEDGSLRGYCGEYVTKPMTYPYLQVVVDRFYSRNKFDQSNFTERCSAHVHVNVQEFTVEQLNTFFSLYQLFERTLFKFVGDERDKNIFCVPWHDTTITAGVIFSDNSDPVKSCLKWKKWEKYTALNLTRMSDLGTVEFRHLAGQADPKKVLTWCEMISCMWIYARENTYQKVFDTIINMNTSSDYRRFFSEVFLKCAAFFELAMQDPSLEKDMERGVMTFKYALVDELQKKRQPKAVSSIKNRVQVSWAPMPPGQFINTLDLNLPQDAQIVGMGQAGGMTDWFTPTTNPVDNGNF